MKTLKILPLILLFSISLQAQGVFVPGYFIDNEGQRTDCLIKDEEWKNTPRRFDWKTGPDAKVQKEGLENVAEFGLKDRYRFIRAEVQIDRSSDSDERLTYQRTPEWETDTLFLELLLEGKADLFEYRSNTLYRFFYRIDQDSIQQLVYKRYLVESNGNIKFATNNRFRQQLWVDLNCRGRDVNDLRVNYTKSSLLRYFEDYNECEGVTVKGFTGPAKRNPWRVRVTPGMDFTSFSIDQEDLFGYDADFGTQNNLRVGLEVEYVLPVNNDRWSVLGELFYQQFSGTKETLRDEITIDYQSVHLFVGGRYNYRFGEKAAIFLGALYSPPLSVTSGNISFNNLDDLEFSPSHAAAAEIGFEYWRLRVAGRLQTKRSIVTGGWLENYQKYSVILGLRLY